MTILMGSKESLQCSPIGEKVEWVLHLVFLPNQRIASDRLPLFHFDYFPARIAGRIE